MIANNPRTQHLPLLIQPTERRLPAQSQRDDLNSALDA
ncbi:MAG: hypothetical protein ACI835_003881 [Planctomycetota bacterium]|jgi:hypothetical protein